MFGVVFFASKSFLRIEGLKKIKKFIILTRKLRGTSCNVVNVLILIAILKIFQYTDHEKYRDD